MQPKIRYIFLSRDVLIRENIILGLNLIMCFQYDLPQLKHHGLRKYILF